VLAQLGLGVEGLLDATLPAPIEPTIYSRVREVPAAIMVIVAAAFTFRRRARSKN
jgi:apolipoprotein N-acyltransferase